MHYQNFKDDSAMPKWPQIFFEVISIDSWTRCRTEGYGFTAFPYRYEWI